MELVTLVYKATDRFPRDELFNLIGQVRRAVISIPSNIAEGAARQTKKEFANYLHMAQGSLSELDTQLELARRLNYLDEHAWIGLDEHMDRIDKMISGLIRRQKSPHA